MSDRFAFRDSHGIRRSITRADRRRAEAIERQSLGGNWPAWEFFETPNGMPGNSGGWTADIRQVWRNGFFAVLIRPLPTGVHHLAIRTPTGREPRWRDLQRIKNEIFGPERFAVQVCPPESRLIDEADMYHLWIMPEGFTPGFGLHQLDEVRP